MHNIAKIPGKVKKLPKMTQEGIWKGEKKVEVKEKESCIK